MANAYRVDIETTLEYFAFWFVEGWERLHKRQPVKPVEVRREWLRPRFERVWEIQLPPMGGAHEGDGLGFVVIRASEIAPARVIAVWWGTGMGFHSRAESGEPVTAFDLVGEVITASFFVQPLALEEDTKLLDQAIADPARPNIYQESNIKTTLAHYLRTQLGKTIAVATGLVGVSERTYRRQRKAGKLLSDDEFRRRTGTAIDLAANMVMQGTWYV